MGLPGLPAPPVVSWNKNWRTILESCSSNGRTLPTCSKKSVFSSQGSHQMKAPPKPVRVAMCNCSSSGKHPDALPRNIVSHCGSSSRHGARPASRRDRHSFGGSKIRTDRSSQCRRLLTIALAGLPVEGVLIPAGTFSMGSAKYPEEGPVHDVQLKAWLESQGRRTSFPKNPELPATQVSWHDAAAYCGWVHKRLPTEAE